MTSFFSMFLAFFFVLFNVGTGERTHFERLNTGFSPKGPRVLALTATKAWVHPSIPSAVDLLKRHSLQRHWNLTVSPDANEHFNSVQQLRNFDVIVFLLTTGPIFTDVQKASFVTYVREGGAVAGIHSAVDTNREWPFFTDLLGAKFSNHPHIQWARMHTTIPKHATTWFMPSVWWAEEEIYNFVMPFRRDDKHVLLRVDESTYNGGKHGVDHPLSWVKFYGAVGSRVWVTVMGHSGRSYLGMRPPDLLFQRHVALGVEWAANGTAAARQRAWGLGQKQ